MEITDIDYKILSFIDKRGYASMDSIKAKFKNVSAVEYRVKMLSKPEYARFANTPISHAKENTSYLSEDIKSERASDGGYNVEHLGIYRLTEFGGKSLQDYKGAQKCRGKEMWVKNAWIPVLVSVVTNLAISGIKWLLPLIQEWLTHTPG